MEDHVNHDVDQATVIENIETLFEDAKAFGKTNVDLFKLRAADRASDIISSLVSYFLVILVLSMFVIIVNIGIALWLGELLGKTYYGFFILAGFYLLIGLIFFNKRDKWFQIPVGDMIVKKIFK